MKNTRVRKLASTMLVLGSLVSGALAHDPGLSIAEITLGDRVAVHLVYPRADFEAAFPTAGKSDRLDDVARRAVVVRVDGGDASIPVGVSTELDEGDVRIELEFDVGAYRRLELESVLIAELSRGHRQYVSVRDAHGVLREERMLDRTSASLTFTATEWRR